jgi:hypothetical protein
MPHLRWTVPVAHWSFWSPTSAMPPDAGFIAPMVRRRLSSLSKAALKVAHDCAQGQRPVRMVFASRHGELRRTTDILRTLTAAEPVSPNAFSLSVLNAMSGIYGISRGDRSPATAISAGPETLGYALLEAYTQFMAEPSPPVLLVYADEPADPLYGNVEYEVQEGALAILLDANAPQGRLECTVSEIDDPRSDTQDDPREAAPIARFDTQGEAVLHCLNAGNAQDPHGAHDTPRITAWQNANANWQWRWHGGTA